MSVFVCCGAVAERRSTVFSHAGVHILGLENPREPTSTPPMRMPVRNRSGSVLTNGPCEDVVLARAVTVAVRPP